MTQSNEEFWESMKPWMERAFKLKKVMLEKKIRQAQTTCLPPCKGFIIGYLAGPKNHLHAGCSECKRRIME